MTSWKILARDLALWWCKHFHGKHHGEKTYGPHIREITCRKCGLRYPIMHWPT